MKNNKNYQTISKSDLKVLYSKVCDDWKLKIANVLMESENLDKIEVSNDLIKRAYSEANDEQKKLIDKYFEVIDNNLFKIKTYSAVCEQIEEDELTLSQFNFLPKEQRKKALAQAKIGQLERCFNQDWKKDWNNRNQYKYYPYFSGSGSIVLVNCNSYCYVGAFNGVAGFYKDSEIAIYIGKTFIDIYEDLK